MKKIILVVSFFILIGIVKAQVYIQGGLTLSNITKPNEVETEKNKILATFNVGVLSRFALSETVGMETGLLFIGKGSKAQTYFNGGTDYVKSTFNPYYLEVPLNLLLYIPSAKKVGLYVSVGPYAAMAIAGKAKLNSKIGIIETSVTKDIQFSNDDPFTSEQEDAGYNKLKRFDFGLNFGVGVKLDKIILKLGSSTGLTKINSTEKNNSADENNKYATINLSVGFVLGK
ncbi:MAG: porin family protein [Bacteroidota bacterium]